MAGNGNFKKVYVYGVGAILILLACYQFALRPTLNAWKINRELKAQFLARPGYSQQPDFILRKQQNLGHILNSFKQDTSMGNSSAINIVAEIAENCGTRLKQSPPIPDAYMQQDSIIAYSFLFEGDYFSLLNTIKVLENRKHIGLLRSVSLKAPDAAARSRGELLLTMKIYLFSPK